jgi:hypothetical protein
MSYGRWTPPKKLESRGHFEKVVRRKGLAEWDARWHVLSVAARRAFLDELKGPTLTASTPVGIERFAPETLVELVAAGFVVVRPPKKKNQPGLVAQGSDVPDFAIRARCLQAVHLLKPDHTGDIITYFEANSNPGPLASMTERILLGAGITGHLPIQDVILRYVIGHRWSGWVADYLKDKTANAILDALRESDRPVLLAELSRRIGSNDPNAVRAALDNLVTHLAVVEDLDPETLDLVVGILPVVRAFMAKASQPPLRLPLVSCETPLEVGPEGGIIVDDLRAFLLEAAGDPPRLRQDDEIFAKEIDRFREALSPLAPWVVAAFGWSDESRLFDALEWARFLELVRNVGEGNETRLRLTPKGEQWLAAPLQAQHLAPIERVRVPLTSKDFFIDAGQFLLDDFDDYATPESSDFRFLASPMLVLKHEKGKARPYWRAKPEDHLELRESLFRCLDALPTGVFFTANSCLPHLVFGPDNPLLLGMSSKEVSIYEPPSLVPDLEEEREATAIEFLDSFIVERLLPLGAFKAARNAEGELCLAREPLFDAYFGRKLPESALVSPSHGASRVVVQPDFSIIVIGLDPTPTAALVPFCERQKRGSGPGSMVLKITRDSVVRAVANGFKPADLLDRLKKFATVDVPSNVLKEVETWANWVRHVTPSTLTVIRCPDRDTADRVVSALKRGAERLSDTVVALDLASLTSVERSKLKEQGIIVAPGAKAPRKPKAAKGRRSY